MDKQQLQDYLNQFVQSDEPANFRPSDTEGILVSDIPEDIDEKGIHLVELEGSFKSK